MKIRQSFILRFIVLVLCFSSIYILVLLIIDFKFCFFNVLGLISGILLLFWFILLLFDVFNEILLTSAELKIKTHFKSITIPANDIMAISFKKTNQLMNFAQGKKIIIQTKNNKYEINIVNEELRIMEYIKTNIKLI